MHFLMGYNDTTLSARSVLKIHRSAFLFGDTRYVELYGLVWSIFLKKS